MIVLPLVSLANVMYFVSGRSEWYYWLMFKSFLFYIVLDSVIVLVKPNCVGSPRTIQIHHVITSAGYCLQLIDHNFREFAALALLVEINTWFKIGKRYLKDYWAMDMLFYLTWFFFRVGMYPYLTYATGLYFFQRWVETGAWFDLPLLHWAMCISLTLMNYKWTYDLVTRGGYLGVSVVHSQDGKIRNMVNNGSLHELPGDLTKLTVAQLRVHLKERELPTGCRTKADLVNRLEEWRIRQGFL